MKRRKLKGEIFRGSFYAKVDMWVGKDKHGIEKMSMWFETSTPFNLVKAEVAAPATTKKRKRKA